VGVGVGVGVGVSPPTTSVVGGSSTGGLLEGAGFFLQDFDLTGGDGWGAPVGKDAVLDGNGEIEGEGAEGEPWAAARVATGGPGKM